MLEDLVQARPRNATNLRVFIEYQYSESFEFFALFNPITRLESIRVTNAADCTDKIFFALQYQEYVREEDVENKTRAVAFPKVLILEQVV